MTPLLDAVAFTAAREWDDASASVALNVLVQIPPARAYVTGGCRGGDSFLGHWCAVTHRAAEHVVIIPANRSQVDPWWNPGSWSGAMFRPRVTLIEMPPGSTYKDRNAALVKWGTVTYGLPAYPEDDPRSVRSGTWQAIRLARKAGTLISWCCVQPPYRGRIEGNINHFLAGAGR